MYGLVPDGMIQFNLRVNFYYHLGEYLPFEPMFVKSGTTSLRFTNQKSALESCHLHLEVEDEDNLLYPYNPCRHGYSFAGIEGSGMHG